MTGSRRATNARNLAAPIIRLHTQLVIHTIQPSQGSYSRNLWSRLQNTNLRERLPPRNGSVNILLAVAAQRDRAVALLSLPTARAGAKQKARLVQACDTLVVEAVPEPPMEPHVWLWAEWPPRGDPAPGVLVGWHLSPTRSTQSPWWVQIAVQRAPGTVALSWVAAQRIGPLRDCRPGEPRRGVRHVWVHRPGPLKPTAALLVDWRRANDGWVAQVAMVDETGLLLAWQPASQVTPVADDTWTNPEVIRLKRG